MSVADTLEQLNNLDLSDIDFERIGVWPVIARIFGCVLLSVGIFIAAYMLFISDHNVAFGQTVARETE